MFSPGCIAASIAYFVSFEVGNLIETLGWLGFIADLGRWAFVTLLRIEAVVYLAVEVGWTVEPFAGSDEDAAGEPLRAIVAVWSAAIWSYIVVTIRAVRGCANRDVDLSLCRGDCCRAGKARNQC